jgi:hypothetical protein
MELPVPPLYIDELGLSKIVSNHEELRVLLGSTNPSKLRQQLSQLRKHWYNKGLFFSDGKATDRVMALILKLIE